MLRYFAVHRCHQLLTQATYNAKIIRRATTKTGGGTKDNDFCIQPVGEKDMVGPPDPVSNIRPILVHIPASETDLEKHYRLQRDEVQRWNQEFWTNHNTRFIKEREQFVKDARANNSKEDCENKTLTADEMSVFYKRFLDSNWKVHVTYNKEWYKKNIGLMLQSFQVQISRNVHKIIEHFKMKGK